MKARKVRLYHVYRGILIHRNTEPHKLRYWAKCGPEMIAADTLDGMRKLIVERFAAWC